MPEFYIIIARKIFSRILGGTCPPSPVSFTPMALVKIIEDSDRLRLVLGRRKVVYLFQCAIFNPIRRVFELFIGLIGIRPHFRADIPVWQTYCFQYFLLLLVDEI